MPSLFRLPTAYQMKHTLLSMTFQALCYIILTLHSYYLTSAQIHVGNIVAAQEMFPPVPYLVFSYALTTLEESWEQTNGFDNTRSLMSNCSVRMRQKPESRNKGVCQ